MLGQNYFPCSYPTHPPAIPSIFRPTHFLNSRRVLGPIERWEKCGWMICRVWMVVFFFRRIECRFWLGVMFFFWDSIVIFESGVTPFFFVSRCWKFCVFLIFFFSEILRISVLKFELSMTEMVFFLNCKLIVSFSFITKFWETLYLYEIGVNVN